MYIFRRLCSSVPFQWSEIVLAEDQKGRQRLFQLKEGGRYDSSAGQLHHDEIAGKGQNQKFKTHLGCEIWLRRPTLAEYTCLMRRVATPTYPKDIWALVGYLDIGGGSVVVEAGTGSGALTLHLSKLVGASGCIYSFETVPKHQAQAKANYHNWCSSWNCTHPDNTWPDNIHFIEATVSDAHDHIGSCVDAVALDLVNPWSVLDGLVNVLRPGAILAAYLPNVTQVLNLRAHLDHCQLPLKLEKVVEVVHRDWTVKPAATKHRAALERIQSCNSILDGPSLYSRLHGETLKNLKALL